MALATPIDSRNLTEQVAGGLAERLGAGEFDGDRKLPTEAELATQYGVSRTVVREAISQLRARGIVETRRGIGTFMRAPPRGERLAFAHVDQAALGEVLALLELRISVETEAAALAAKRATPSHVERLGAVVERLRAAARDGGDAADADFEFHVAIAEATGNHFFADLLSHLGRTIIPRTRIDSPAAARQDRAAYLRTVNAEHEVIHRAIAQGDSDAARAAMRTHLANSRERLRQLRGGDDGGSS